MTTTQAQKLTLGGFLVSLAGAILFSTKAIIVKLAFAATTIDAVSLLTLRMLCSLPFYLAVALFTARKQGTVSLTRRQWWLTLTIGFTGYYLSSLFDFLGLQYISAGLERLILFLYPTFAVLINYKAFGQRIGRNQLAGLLLTYAGILIAFAGEMKIAAGDAGFYWGSFLVFLCAVTYSFYLSGSGRIIPQLGATRFTAYAMLSATAGILVHFLLRGDYSALRTPDAWWYGLLLAALATVLPSFLLAFGMKKIGSNNVAIILSVGPVSTIAQAHVLLGEPVLPTQLAGTVLVVAGVLLLGWKRAE